MSERVLVGSWQGWVRWMSRENAWRYKWSHQRGGGGGGEGFAATEEEARAKLLEKMEGLRMAGRVRIRESRVTDDLYVAVELPRDMYVAIAELGIERGIVPSDLVRALLVVGAEEFRRAA